MPDPIVQQVLWNELATHIIKHFYCPDLQALRVVFSVVHAHYSAADPAWMFVIGPAGSGKTSVAVNCISGLPDVVVVSDLTPRSFIAGKAGKSTSTLLNRKSIILVFKDFTTMISKREESQREIVAALREIYDGQFSYRTSEAFRQWEGKCTVIAAVTPAIERAWSIHRDLGERFGQVRWHNTKRPTEAARMARAQLGHERETAAMMRALTQDVFNAALDGPAYLPEAYGNRIDCAASAVAKLRANVIRDSAAGRPIIDTSAPEEPTRIAKGLTTIACHHAALFGRVTVIEEDLQVAMRSALDTIPSPRLSILQAIPGTYPISDPEVRSLIEVPRQVVAWHTDELDALGIIRMFKVDEERQYAFSPAFWELWESAGMG